MDDKRALITGGQPLQNQCKHERDLLGGHISRVTAFLKMQGPMHCETEVQNLINGFHAKTLYFKALKMKMICSVLHLSTTTLCLS